MTVDIRTQVEVRGCGTGRKAAEDDPFEHLVWIFLHQDPVIERARFAFVGVQAEVDRSRVVFGQERPLQARREPGAAAAAQTAGLHDIDDVIRRLRRENSTQCLIAAGRLIDLQRMAVFFANIR